MAPTTMSRRWKVSSVNQPYGICEFGHQGLYHDEESGLAYNYARYLSPISGRFLSRDPIGYGIGTLNLYEYVGSSLNYWLDPTGLAWYDGWWEAIPALWGGADSEIQAAFDHSNSDVVNGYGDAIGVNGLAGHNHTFDPTQRKEAECFAKCMGKKTIDDFIDNTAGQYVGPLSPFVRFGTDGIGMQNPFDDKLGATTGAAAGVYGYATFMRKWGGRVGAIESFMRNGGSLTEAWRGYNNSRDFWDSTSRGRRLGKIAKYAKGIGAAAYAAKLIADMNDCWKQCKDNPCAYDMK